MRLEKRLCIVSILAAVVLLLYYIAIRDRAVVSQTPSSSEHNSNVASPPQSETLLTNYRTAFEFPEMPGLEWTGSPNIAIRRSVQSGKPVLLAIESANSVYAAKNRRIIARDEALQNALKDYVLLALFIDHIPDYVLARPLSSERMSEEVEANREFWFQILNDATAPTYAVLEPKDDGTLRLIEHYNLREIENTKEFVQFLKKHARSRN